MSAAIDKIAIAACKAIYSGSCSCDERGTGACETMKGVADLALRSINIRPYEAHLLECGLATVRLKPQKKVKT